MGGGGRFLFRCEVTRRNREAAEDGPIPGRLAAPGIEKVEKKV